MRTAETYEFLESFFVDGLAPRPGPWAGQFFVEGRLGSYVGSTATERSLVRADVPFEWGVAALPAGSTGRASGPLWVNGWVVPAGSANVEAAMGMLAYLASDAGQALQSSPELSNGVAASAAVNERLRSERFPGLSARGKRVVFDAVEHSRPFTTPLAWARVVDSFEREFTLVGQGRRRMRDALAILEETVEPVLAEGA